jgi:hypothetical protein
MTNPLDDDPKYYADIYVKCECSDFVDFLLPVN